MPDEITAHYVLGAGQILQLGGVPSWQWLSAVVVVTITEALIISVFVVALSIVVVATILVTVVRLCWRWLRG